MTGAKQCASTFTKGDIKTLIEKIIEKMHSFLLITKGCIWPGQYLDETKLNIMPPPLNEKKKNPERVTLSSTCLKIM